MRNNEVEFIHRKYSFPADLIVYLDLLEFTEDIRQNLNKDFYKLLQNADSGCIDDGQFVPEIEKQVSRVISKLLETEIFDRTVNDYLQENKGFELISKVNQAALSKMKELLIKQIDEYQSGVEDALNKRDSSITGMGFSIWSGSFVNHAIYAAMEASTLSKQEAEATKEYNREIAELHNNITRRHDGAQKDYIDGVYIPNMEAAIAVFSYELLDMYVTDLINNKKMDEKVLNYINIDRSNDLLKNLELSTNKEAIICKAFEACPYNLQVYEKTLNYGFMDHSTFQTAKYFKKDQDILFALIANLGEAEYPEKFELNYYVSSTMAECLQTDEQSILKAKTQKYANAVINAYIDTVSLLNNQTKVIKVMKELSDADILLGQSSSNAKACSYVSELVPDNAWKELTEKCGYRDLLKRIKDKIPDSESCSSKKDVDSLLVGKLSHVFEEARQVIEKHILEKQEIEERQRALDAENERLKAEKNRKIKRAGIITSIVLCFSIIIVVLVFIISNSLAYKGIAGDYCVYSVIDDDGDKRDDNNVWLSIEENGTIELSLWSYVQEDTMVIGYQGKLKKKADYTKFENIAIKDYGADDTEYSNAKYCYEFHVENEIGEQDGYLVCWQYCNGNIVDVYLNNCRYSFVETNEDYDFARWNSEINSDRVTNNVVRLVDEIDVSEEDVINEIESLTAGGYYNRAVEGITTSRLSDEQKKAYYDTLVENIDFQSFSVNGLVINVPEEWIIEDDDLNIKKAEDSNNNRLSWYFRCIGTIEQVIRDEENYWEHDSEGYQAISIPGCEQAFIRTKYNKTVKTGDSYSVIDYYAICHGFVFDIQYFAYDDRFYEPEANVLMEHIEFIQFSENDVQEKRKEETYENAHDLLLEEKYDEAIYLLEQQMDDYKDSQELLENAIMTKQKKIDEFKAGCIEITKMDDIVGKGSIDIKVHAKVDDHIRNNDYYLVTEDGNSIKMTNYSDREELIEGTWITAYGSAYSTMYYFTFDVKYIE